MIGFLATAVVFFLLCSGANLILMFYSSLPPGGGGWWNFVWTELLVAALLAMLCWLLYKSREKE